MDLFSFVKNNVEIISVISEYTSVKKTGSLYWKGLCPFHHEKTPSFTVSPHKNIFYCFGCHETGDVINFIEKIENCSAFDATKHLIERFNLEVPEETLTSSPIKKDRNILKLYQIVAQWCNDKLLKNKQSLQYLQQRQISKDIISQFSIGYFPAGSRYIQELLSHVLQHNFSSKDLLQEFILFQGKGSLYSPFEDRIIFPIKDHLGQTCAFGGRVFKQNDQRPKYYNSKETPHFKKGKMLFGLDVAKQEIQKKKTVCIVEGYTDCIAMQQHGYINTVATLGTACTTEHLKQLNKHAQSVYILYDADQAGKQAILRLTQSCWQLDMELKVVTLPINQDPASILEQDKTITPYIEKSVDIFTFFLQTTGQQFQKQSIREKLHAINDLLDLIKNISDSLKQDILLMKASQIMQVPLDILKKEYTSKYKTHNFKKSVQPKAQKSNTIDMLEQQILAAVLHDPTVITKQHEDLLLTQCSETTKNILTKIIEYPNKDEPISFIQKILTPEQWQYAQKILFTIETSNVQQTFVNLWVQFQKKHWKSIISHLKLKLMKAKQENNKEKMKELLALFEKFKKDMYKNGKI